MATAEIRTSDTEGPPIKKCRLEEDVDTEENTSNTTTKEEEKDDDVPSQSISSTSGPTTERNPRGAVLEADVGITEYISNHIAFNGIIKQRYSDFLVNEIDLDGKIVRLTDVDSPETKTNPESSPDCETSVLSEQWKTQLKTLLDQKNEFNKVFLPVGEDKRQRADIHTAIRQHYPGLDSSTGEHEGKKCITVTYKAKRSKDERQRDPWPSGRGDYCHFILYKENKDTSDAVNIISRMLRMKAGCFTFAGTKDRRAKTCQWISVYRVPGSRLHQLNKGLRGMAVGNFKYCNEPLKLGDLRGNHFVIVLRNLSGDDTEVNSAMTSLRDHGFINFYGMQRFGTTAVPTHHVGRALLQGRWSNAIDLILQPREGESDDLAEARTIWATSKDAAAALAKIKRRECLEKNLLFSLKRCDSTDYMGALSALPRNTRLMYVHAYQSYIWNILVSRRIRQYGLGVLPGDLVLKRDVKLTSAEKKPQVVTEATVSETSIYDVVLPLPGWDIQLPTNPCGQWYEEMLASDDLTQAMLKNKVKDYSLPGDYRHLVVRPDNVTWSILNYDDVMQPLALSDFEKLRGETLTEPSGKLQALRLELSLPSSCYATMALREVLRTDTSSSHQMTLNKH